MKKKKTIKDQSVEIINIAIERKSIQYKFGAANKIVKTTILTN